MNVKSLHLRGWYQRSLIHLKRISSSVPPSVITLTWISFAVTGIVVSVKQLGGLEPLELRAYDQLIRLRSDQPADPRLLVVTITEEDLRIQRRSTLSDQAVAAVLSRLQQYQPAVIGLDLYRDLPQPPGHPALQAQLQAPNLIAITKLGNTETDAIPPPAGVPSERVGFNDFPVDPDGIVRRSLLFGGTAPAFSVQLAFSYLKQQGITPTSSPEGAMRLGTVTFVPLEANSGGYQTNDARGYQVLLNYRTRQPVAREVTLTQVLEGAVPPEWVKNKIVLMGTTASSSRDLFYTPYSASEIANHQMPGVAIHAQMVSQILSAALDQRSLMGYLPEWQEWLWIAIWSFVGGSLAWQIHAPLKLGIACSGVLIALGGISFWQLTQAVWMPMGAPAIAAMLTVAAMITHRAQQAQRQQQMVMTLLGQSASKEIADALWSHRDRLLTSGKLPGQKLVATMLFTDIRGFSTISESILPELLLEWLNEYLDAMTQEIQRHRGIINKFTGDGLLAVFGVPVPRLTLAEIDQDAHQAVACALAMGDRLSHLNLDWQRRGLPMVKMRVGICTGAIVAGSLGGKDRMEYGVIGDSVNIASRLESCAKEIQEDLCRILIAGETLSHVYTQFKVESWGAMALKGKEKTVEVYRVLGTADSFPQEVNQVS